MARFKYMGETPVPGRTYGPCLQIKLHTMTGIVTLDPPSGPAFVVGDDIGVDITDSRCLRAMRVDPRFVELI